MTINSFIHTSSVVLRARVTKQIVFTLHTVYMWPTYNDTKIVCVYILLYTQHIYTYTINHVYTHNSDTHN